MHYFDGKISKMKSKTYKVNDLNFALRIPKSFQIIFVQNWHFSIKDTTAIL